MKTVFAVTFLLLVSACATSGRPGEATRTASRDALARCAAGYTEYPAGSGVCEPYDAVQQRQAGPIRQTLGGAMAQPMPSVGGLHR